MDVSLIVSTCFLLLSAAFFFGSWRMYRAEMNQARYNIAVRRSIRAHLQMLRESIQHSSEQSWPDLGKMLEAILQDWESDFETELEKQLRRENNA